MKEKIKNFYNSKWFTITFFAFAIVTILIHAFNTKRIMSYEGDIWHIMNNGRFVLNNGFAMSDEPFTLHEGWYWVPQQWLTGVFYYLIYKNFNVIGMAIATGLLTGLEVFVIYKTLQVVSHHKINKQWSIILCNIFLIITLSLFAINPRFFDVIFICLSILIVEFYKKTNKFFLTLILSVATTSLFINLHSALWPIIFVYPFFFLVTNIKNKTIRIHYAIIILCMLGALFINPYGYNLVLYSSGSIFLLSSDSFIIEEIQPATIKTVVIFFTLILTIVILPIVYYKSSQKEDRKIVVNDLFKNEYFLYLILAMIMSFLQIRNFLLFTTVLLIYIARNIDYFKNLLYIKYLNLIDVSLKLIFVCYFVVFGSMFKGSTALNAWNGPLNDVINTIQEDAQNKNIEPTNIKVYNPVNEGQYFEYVGKLKVYCDCRFEIYYKQLNRKDDVASEITTLQFNNYIEQAIDKYHFDYLILDKECDYILLDSNKFNNESIISYNKTKAKCNIILDGDFYQVISLDYI